MKHCTTIIIVIFGAVIVPSLAQDLIQEQDVDEYPDENLNQVGDEMPPKEGEEQNGEEEHGEGVEEYGLLVPADFESVPVNTHGRDDKPEHGACYRKPFHFCSNRGEKIAYRGRDSCMDCYCGHDRREVCCKRNPYPRVRNPLLCKIELNPKTCVYERNPKCKKFCEIIGWHSSE